MNLMASVGWLFTKEFAIAVCDRVGGPNSSVKQRHFAENFARSDDVQDRVAAIG